MTGLDSPHLPTYSLSSISRPPAEPGSYAKSELSGTIVAFDTGIPVPEGWKTCTHPQGWVYFVNPTAKLVTDHDIRNQDLYTSIMRDANRGFSLGGSMEMHFFARHSIGSPGQNMTNLILFIDHSRCIAYYEDELESATNKQAELDPRRAIRRARLYWNYVWSHPAHIPTPERAATEALDVLTWFYTDNLISGNKSTVPFAKAECEDLLRIVHQLSDPTYGHSPARTAFLSWILRESYKYRDAEQHGQHTAKEFLNHQTGKRPQPEPLPNLPAATSFIQSLVIRCLFFGIPNAYFLHVKLTSEYRGRLASVQSNWERYVDRLVREYSHFLLISTVLLSATIGFLSAQDIPELSIFFSITSALASLGSIIIGVFSMWAHQAKTQKGDFFAYLHNAKHRYFGLLGHAIMLSLPAVLLVWAILTFTIALVAFVMQLGIQNTNVLTRVSAWAILGVLVALLIAVISALYTFSVQQNSLYLITCLAAQRMSDSNAQLPKYLYKLIPPSATPPDPIPEELPLSELDEKSGFIHLSTASQVPGTLKHFFADEERMYILRIPFELVKDKIRWESPDKKGATFAALRNWKLTSVCATISRLLVCGPRPEEGLFPHLYDGKLGKEEIELVLNLGRKSGWGTVMETAKSEWLVY
ncbi:hypothetical protein D9756_000511 [Leucocoprinus leucothites]|uniref:Uncharacterized protein n=1 Tax=Leucocoprinus leucothites TaxID=201217 RepID=A0A8H5GFD0_9AGAR|nr:hypothetical protein D9756_000511 [Leucoagaricus leucothites]